MSKSSKPSDEPKDAVSDAVDESLIDPAETAETSDTLGVAKKTKAEREAEKEEARREKERETLRRRTTPQPVKLDGGKNPGWWVPTMLSLMGAGLLWLVVYYLSTTMEPNAKGERIRVEGVVIDGTGSPVKDVLIEVWQANAEGIYAHSEVPGEVEREREHREGQHQRGRPQQVDADLSEGLVHLARYEGRDHRAPAFFTCSGYVASVAPPRSVCISSSMMVITRALAE